LYEYFKELNNYEEDDDDDDIDLDAVCHNPLYDILLNDELTEREILNAIKGLKNNKSPGPDSVLNEYLKNSPPYLIRILYRLFNLVLDTGIIPENWTIGIIKPVYKNKGNNLDLNISERSR
jgi:hypothetical protein